LHKYKVIHRDLKTENIFKHNEKYKIGDLGFAKILTDIVGMDMRHTALGTITTMAP
jgi:serine/threonine protein kinase